MEKTKQSRVACLDFAVQPSRGEARLTALQPFHLFVQQKVAVSSPKVFGQFLLVYAWALHRPIHAGLNQMDQRGTWVPTAAGQNFSKLAELEKLN